MTYWIILVIAIILTYLSLKRYHFAFSIGATLSWFAVWAYHLNYPPTGITAGTFVFDLLYYAYILMALAVFFIYISGRNKQKKTTKLSIVDGKIVAMSTEETVSGEEEYRRTIKKALRRRR